MIFLDKNIIKKIIGLENVVIYDGYSEFSYNFPFGELFKTAKKISCQRKKLIYNVITSFDIETTRIADYSFCYVWQFNIYMNGVHHVIIDRVLSNVKKVFEKLAETAKARYDSMFICAIQNLGYEFQFCKNLLDWKKVFAKEKRQPITAQIDGFYFIDTMQISHKNLKKIGDEVGVKKLTEKFDYSKIRTSDTKMTNEEYSYCVNDVIIPVLYTDMVIKNFVIPKKFLPITQTSKVRFKMKSAFKNEYMEEWKEMADYIGDKLYPPTFEDYKNEIQWLFRGAWTHGNPMYTGNILQNVNSYDITSSYIYTMFCDKFPMSKFTNYDGDIEKIDTSKYAFKGVFIFYNIRTKNKLAYESVHKCVAKDLINDNGKVYYASELKVMLTDIDFYLYNKLYEWESYEIFDLQISKKGYLPQYVIEPMVDAYSLKQEKKLRHEGYVQEKEEVNSFYGMMVTRIPIEESNIENGEWVTVSRDNPYKDRNRSFLSPYWGIWVTAYSRKHLFDGIECFDTFYYSDTDSVKGNVSRETLDKLNKKIFENVQNAKKHFEINNNLIDDLGQWDNEGDIRLFKYLGAKRYLCHKNGKTVATIAGCPKNEYQKNYKNSIFAKQFSEFQNNFSIKSVKLRSLYDDKSHEFVVNGCTQQTYGSNTLIPTDFSLSMTGVYIEFIKWLQKNKSEGKNYD